MNANARDYGLFAKDALKQATQFLKTCGITQRDIAERLDVSFGYFTEILCGQKPVLHKHAVALLALVRDEVGRHHASAGGLADRRGRGANPARPTGHGSGATRRRGGVRPDAGGPGADRLEPYTLRTAPAGAAAAARGSARGDDPDRAGAAVHPKCARADHRHTRRL